MYVINRVKKAQIIRAHAAFDRAKDILKKLYFGFAISRYFYLFFYLRRSQYFSSPDNLHSESKWFISVFEPLFMYRIIALEESIEILIVVHSVFIQLFFV